MVVENQDTGGSNNAHPSGIPQDQIDNIMSGIANTGDVKMNNHRKKLRQRFDIIKKLGQGTYGKVQLGINKETGQEVAIKTIKKCKIEAEADLVRIRREVQIMSSVQHPNIIHIYEVFENREKMVLVMEFAAGGELYDYLSERKVLSEEEARRIFRQVATAVYYCHKHKICHRDLKLENILLDENGNAKIADFGLSNVFDEQCLLATFCGSPLYASPEIVEGTPYHGPEVDCWSLGVLLYTLVYGSMPFDGSNFKRLVKQISQGDYYEPKKPSRASSLIKEMLTVCPRKRATIEQICSHWWVNENDNVSCLELAEDLANRTPVRLDVLLSLTPAAITAEQLVVPSAESSNSGGKNASIPRSHSVGSIREVVPNTEAERRILNMVAAGGEAALMPSPTRTITPSQSPVQTKRKLENTISTDNAGGVVLKKKDKIDDINVNALLENESTLESASVELQAGCPTTVETESMETDDVPTPNTKSLNFSTKDMELVDNLCEKLITDKHKTESSHEHTMYDKEKFTTIENMSENTIDITEESPERTKGATKVIKKFVNKHKTADLVNVIGQIDPDESISSKNQCLPDNNICTTTSGGYKFVRKCSLQDETPLNKFSTERRKSRILETAEKFQQMNNANVIVDRAKKIIIPGVSVGNFKKEYERKTLTGSVNSGLQIATGERRTQEKVSAEAVATTTTHDNPKTLNESDFPTDVEASDSKTSVASFSLDEARRSMENSIALLRQAQTESSKDVNQLCAKTDNIHVSESHSTKTVNDRERKLMNARAIIGNAIQPVSQGPGDNSIGGTMKTSTASITLKSATLPRRKTAKTEIQLDIKPPIAEQPSMRFTTEMQHPVADLRSAPPREGPVPYSPIKTVTNQRSSSLEPKEHVIPIQRPPSIYTRTVSNTTNKSGSLSRQSTNDSESDTINTSISQATVTGSSQPIKKSPREFIIPIAVEGGGFITPREGSIEPSESSQTTATTSSRSTFTRLRPTRRIGSMLSESGVDEVSPFQKLRTSSSIRDGDDDARFTLHKLRSSRPVKKISQENDSQSSGEEDDDDGFEILTAENLFSTLLQRVRALTNRMNVNNDITSAFPTSSSLLSNMRQAQSPFWNQEPFGSRLNSASINAPWRHSMARDLGSDMDSMFSRTGATLPRDTKASDILLNKKSNTSTDIMDDAIEEPLDLADLDLSRLRLSKKDLETLSNIAPGLPKSFQEQLLAKLPPTQARKLSRTLSVQTNQNCALVQISKRSHSSTRNVSSANKLIENDGLNELEYSKTMTKAITEKPTVETKNKTKSSSSTHKIHSRSKSNDENSKDFGSLCNSEISDKYKYYSPYVNKIIKDASHKNTSPKECSQDTITVGATLGRPPSGRVSPTSLSDSNIKKPVQRRISRLIRPDIFEMPLEELETAINDTSLKIKNPRHSRNRSVELLSESSNSGKMEKDTIKHNRRSLSRSRDIDENNKFDKNQLADKILQELQILSSIRSQEVDIERGNIIKDNENINEKSVSINKKNKKLKAKEKPSESFIEIDLKDQNSVVKKIKKIVKKSETLTTPVLNKISNENLIVNTNNEDSPIAADNSPPKKLSKLKRPKSYPMKDCISNSNTSEICSSSLSNKILETNGLVIADPSSTTDNLKVTNINNITPIVPRDSRILRPKSYPTSKLITPKETKHTNLRKKVNTMDETTTKCTKDDKIIMITSHVSDLTSSGGKNIKKNKNSQYSSITTTPATTTNTMSNTVDESKESIPVSSFQLKDKGGEKKTNKGLLYAIGQKFEKLRASATSNSCANPPTHKKTSCDKLFPEKTLNKLSEVKETKSLSGNKGIKSTQSEEIKTNTSLNVAIHNGTTEIDNTSKPIKSEKRSRIDTMIRNLRERSVPRSQTEIPSESNYIKRAVSVEEMPGTFNKKSVNKVLGLFKRYEKDVNSENQVRSVRSTSNIEIKVSKTSPVYQNANAIQKLNSKINKCGDGGIINRDSNKIYKTCNGTKECRCDMIVTSIPQKMCPDCCIQLIDVESSEGNQEKRKGLVLDLIKSDKIQKQNNVKQNNIRPLKSNQCLNENLIYSNIAPYTKTFQNSSGNGSSIQVTDNNNISSVIKKSNSSINNNNSNNQCSSLHTSQTSGYRTSSTHEMNNQNNNLLSPSFENIGNYSSDSRSYQEDCASTSTFLSPTEDAELCFDTWSICSEDNYRGQRATPSPTVSHLSRASQASSPTRRGGDSSEGGESVVDRIKRRSFYCRFNEKKPKRTSSIVGPNAVREYYREQSSASKTRSSTKISLNTTEREHSPDITQEFLRPLKLSPIGTELKPPVYRSSFSSTHDYSTAIGRPRKSLNDIRTPTSPSCISERRYASFASPERELHCNNPTFPSRYKSNIYDDTPRTLEGGGSSNTYYNTYNPKRRFSFNTNIGLSSNGINSNICSQVEGYATMGRRPIRAYDHRTMSLLDTPNSNTYRHEGSTSSSIRDYTASLSRSNSRYRKSSVPRSPTNI